MEMIKINKERIVFIGIILLGLVLRLLFIDKPAGFWHNEMVMYNQATAGCGCPACIIKASVEADVHFPLYQLLLAVWMKLFSRNDIAIRLFSVFLGVLTIVFAFFTGKEFKDEKLGNIFAFLVAINATLIFYSQEVKFYIMLATLSSMTLLFLARMKNKNDLISHVGYIISNAAIIYTFTIGIFYVFAQFVAFLSYAFVRNRQLLKKFFISNAVLLLLIIPFALYVTFNFGKYEEASWIFTSNFHTFFVLLQNYFSPALISVYNNPIVYVPVIGVMPILFIYLPVSFSIYGIYRAMQEKNGNLIILLIPIIFLFCEVMLCLNSGLRMLTRYTILAIVPLLFLVAIGFYSFKVWTRRIIITYLLIISVFFLIASPTSAVRGYRDLGQKPVADVLVRNKITDNDTIVLGLRKNDFDKYLTFKGRKFSMLQDFVYRDYAFDRTKPDKYESFKSYIFDKGSVNPAYESYFLKTVIQPMKIESRLFLVWDDNYDLYPFKDFKHYRNYPIMTLSLSKTNADTIRICDKYLKFTNIYKLGYYKIFVFEN